MTRKSNHPRVNYVSCENASRSSGTNWMRSSDNNIPFNATRGWPIHRDGSITGLACMAPVTVHLNPGTIQIRALINNSPVVTLTSASVTGTGVEIFYTTASKGGNSVSPGDILHVDQKVGAGTFTTNDVLVIIELEWDT